MTGPPPALLGEQGPRFTPKFQWRLHPRWFYSSPYGLGHSPCEGTFSRRRAHLHPRRAVGWGRAVDIGLCEVDMGHAHPGRSAHPAGQGKVCPVLGTPGGGTSHVPFLHDVTRAGLAEGWTGLCGQRRCPSPTAPAPCPALPPLSPSPCQSRATRQLMSCTKPPVRYLWNEMGDKHINK